MAAATAAVGLALLPAVGTAAKCDSKFDCFDGQRCEEGTCVDAPEPPAKETTKKKGAPAEETDEPEPAELTPAQHADAMVGAGIGLAGVGLFGVAVGIAAIVGGADTNVEYVPAASPQQPPPFPDAPNAGLQIAGGIMLGLGGAMLITGVILIPVGATSAPSSDAGPDAAALVVEPLLGPTSAGVRLRF